MSQGQDCMKCHGLVVSHDEYNRTMLSWTTLDKVATCTCLHARVKIVSLRVLQKNLAV